MKCTTCRRNALEKNIIKTIQKMPYYTDQQSKGKTNVLGNTFFIFVLVCLQWKQYKWIKDLKEQFSFAKLWCSELNTVGFAF